MTVIDVDNWYAKSYWSQV